MKKNIKKVPVFLFALVVFGLWLIALFHISKLWAGDSDNAFLVITGNSVLNGNLLLHGYYLSRLVTYFPFDIYLNALLVKILGFGPLVIHIAPIVIFLIFIFVSYMLAKDANKEKKAFKIGIFMLVVFLALPGRYFAFWTLQELHLSAVVFSLTVFFLVGRYLNSPPDRKSKYRPYAFLTLAFLTLTLSLLNDGLAFLICAAPLLLTSLFFIHKIWGAKMDGKRASRGGGEKEGDSFPGYKKYFLIALVVAVSVILSRFVFFEIRGNGGFDFSPTVYPVAFIHLKYILKNISFYFRGILKLFGAYFFGKKLFSIFTLISLFKIIGIVAFFYGIKISLKKLKRNKESDFTDILLLSGAVFLSVAFILSDIAVSMASARYLVPVVIFGYLLAIRNVERISFIHDNYDKLPLKIFAALIITVYAGSFAYSSLAVMPASPFVPLAKWFEKKDLKYGFGSYFDSGIVTLMSGGKVKVRQVVACGKDKLCPYRWVSKEKWYKKKGFFVIYSRFDEWGGVYKKSVIREFGKPSGIYSEDFQGTIGRAHGRPDGKLAMPPYLIIVYKKGIRLK